MLNCILSMVEKTKRALAILQHRGANSVENGSAGGSNPTNEWLRRSAPTDASETRDIKRTAGEIMAQTIRVTEDRVAEVKRRAGNMSFVSPSFLTTFFFFFAYHHHHH
jgi:runt-related transcription factor 1